MASKSKDDDVNVGNDDGNTRRHKRKRITKSKPTQLQQQQHQPTTTTTTIITCSKCGLELPSRNQLFRHLRSSTKCSLALNDNDSKKDGSAVGGEGSSTTKFVKVILIVAYLGKEYHGCARNDSRDAFPTVEGCLWKGIAGALLEGEEQNNNKKKVAPTTTTSSSFSFALDIRKNTNPKSMTRSSRTDKGVSSLGNVYSLLLPDCALLEDELSFASIVNRHLPNDIRLLRVHINNHSNSSNSSTSIYNNGRSNIPSSFNARTCCEARRYRYLIPTKALFKRHHRHLSGEENDDDKPTSTTTVTEESIMDLRKRLKRVLLQWGGTHSFHNFTNWKKQQQQQPQSPSTSAAPAVASDREHVKNQKVEEDDHSRHILRCHVEDVILQSSSTSSTTCPNSNQDFIVISIKGQSFLYHMIRKMMGATIGVMNGTLSSDFIHRALLQTTKPNDDGEGGSSGISNRSNVVEIMDVPLAPAEGLVLVECIYSKYCSKRNMEPVGLGTKLLSSHHGSGSGSGDKRSESGSVATRVDWEKNAAKLVKDTSEFEKRVYEQICSEQAENYSSL